MSKALKAAIEANDPQATQKALAKIKNINRKLPGADKPLLYACKKGADQVIELLINAGARVPHGFDPLEGPFEVAAECEQTSVLERLLILKLASPESVEHALTLAAMEGKITTLRFLLEWTKQPVTAKLFRLASIPKNPRLIELLLQHGGEINQQEHDKASDAGFTPIHSAAESGDPERMKMLVSFGANPNARDSVGRTPLMALAAELEWLERKESARWAHSSLESLLNLGADATLVDNFGNDALCYYEAGLGGSPSDPTIRKSLMNVGATGFGPTGQLFDAIRSNDATRVKAALAAGADVNRVGPAPSELTPLVCACASVEITGILLAAGANPNRGTRNLPLVSAAGSGYLATVKALLAAGADVHAIEGHGEFKQNAYKAAEMNCQFEVVDYLKSLGAGRPKPTKNEVLKPGIGSWNDFSEVLAKADVSTTANAIARMIQGNVQSRVFGQSLTPGASAYVVVRPKGMQWSNIFRIAPPPNRFEDPSASAALARELAKAIGAPMLTLDYSDTSDAASVVRYDPGGKTERDDGWDHDTLKEMVESLDEVPAWAKKRLNEIDEDGPSSTERLVQLAEAEKFVVAAFGLSIHPGRPVEIEFGDLAVEVFEGVAFVTT